MCNIPDNVLDAFDVMIDDYRSLLKIYYPAYKRTGFTERNLTFYFCKNLLSRLPARKQKPFVWMETPIRETKKHLDALVFSPENKSVFFIEAKRIKSPSKLKVIKEEIGRINDNKDAIIVDDFINNNYNKYIIYLADIWPVSGSTENENKTTIYKNWKENKDSGIIEGTQWLNKLLPVDNMDDNDIAPNIEWQKITASESIFEDGLRDQYDYQLLLALGKL